MLNPNFIQFLHSMILGWEHRCSMRPGTGSTRRPIGSERSVPTGTTSQWVSDSWSSVKKNALVATGNMGSRITMDNPNTSTLSPHLSLSLLRALFSVLTWQFWGNHMRGNGVWGRFQILSDLVYTHGCNWIDQCDWSSRAMENTQVWNLKQRQLP